MEIKKIYYYLFTLSMFFIIIVMTIGFYYIYFRKTLRHLCLLKSSNCVSIYYRRKKNTVLIKCPYDYYIWFTGSTFVVYDKIQNVPCEAGLQPAFVIDATNTSIEGMQCVNELQYVISEYKDEYEYILNINPSDCEFADMNKCEDHPGCKFDINSLSCSYNILGAFDIINLFIKKGIIQLKDIQVKSYAQI